MRSPFVLTSVMVVGLCVVGRLILAGDGSSPVVRQQVAEVPGLPVSETKTVEYPASVGDSEAALGKLLFSGVTRVYFIGPGHPANPDGSLGGLGADVGVPLTIYERFIVREVTDDEGRIYRTLHPYVTLGIIEQRWVPKGVKVDRVTRHNAD
jgi:hypothetical protein